MAKKLIAMFLVFVAVFTCIVPSVSAATISNGTQTRTITVVTKSNWAYPGSESITISQTKGTFTYSKLNWWGQETGKTGSKNVYGTWKIHVEASDGSHSFNKTLSGGSIKLNLKPNKTYYITISYDSYQDVFFGLDYRNFRWSKRPSWRVSKTHKVSSYY